MTKTTRVAVCQYQIEDLPNWQFYQTKNRTLVQQASQQGARLIVFPEYAGFELVGLSPQKDLAGQVNYLKTILDQYIHFYQSLAKEFNIYIQSGTLLVTAKENYFCNRAYLFSPTGKLGFQDKIHLIRSEKDSGLIVPGTGYTIFVTDFAKIGIAVCYDSEFPVLVQQMVKAGADLILVPSCTEGLSGYHRVHLSCRARALENQCFVAQSCIIGRAPACGFIEEYAGSSGIYAPVDLGFPHHGVLAQAEMNKPQIIYADLDFAKMKHIREHGQVTNYLDMTLSSNKFESPTNEVLL